MSSTNYDPFRPVTRIAPTPSGYLHMGNLMNFILTWVTAKSQNGLVWLRIDDIDAERVRIRYLDDIFYQLDKLGMVPDKGPGSVAEHSQVFTQALRIHLYQDALSILKNQGQLFNCSCSRKKLFENQPAGYAGTCLNKNLPFRVNETAVRLKNERQTIVRINDLNGHSRQYSIPDSMSYCVLWRKDNLPAYQLTSVCDDAAMQINCIVRGIDLGASSLFQMLLSEKLGLEANSHIRFLHHGLLTDAVGRKLSKSQADTPVHDLSKKQILQSFTSWAGWKVQAEQLQDLVNYAREELDALASLDSCSNFS